MNDAVLSYFTNEYASGVGKFNRILAERLGVAHRPLTNEATSVYPLVSIKTSEVPAWTTHLNKFARRDLFLHDAPELTEWAKAAIYGSERVIAANPVIADHVRRIKPSVITGWCPSLLQGNPTRGEINILTFGMAHKIQTRHFLKLRALLDATGEDYTVSVSCAIHEGSPWSETWQETHALLGGIFGERLRVLGFLADDALARELKECTAVALFYDPALRANNTTFWAAYRACRIVVTNLDRHSPPVAGARDIDTLEQWPTDGRSYVPLQGESWDLLVQKMRAGVAA